MPSNDDLLFAEHAVRAGYVTQEAVEDSLKVQARMAEMGVQDSLSNVLVKRGLLKQEDAALIARRAGLKGGREPIPGYELVGRIGTGAMGSVYLAFQKGMGRNVAIKILRRDLTDDPRQVDRLRREATLVGQLDHPHIVRGLDSGETGGLVWFVMEYVDGVTLHRLIKDRGRLPLDEALAFTVQIAAALEHAHEHGVVHRDIKPGNVLLSKEGVPRLSDYGLAKGETDDALTHIDATLGTPQYIAPEQARNPRDADIQSDIYSLGATLYAMLVGRPPFHGDTLAQILTKVLYQRPQPLELEVEGIPAAAVYLVEKMMAKRREHRYASPTELLRDLHALTEGKLHVPLGFRGDFEAFMAQRRKRRRLLVGVSAVVVVTLTALGYAWWDRISERREAELRERDRYAAIADRRDEHGSWTPNSIAASLDELDRFVAEYPGHDEARQQLAALRRQTAALDRVSGLRLDPGTHTGPWAPQIRRLRELESELSAQPDSDVAAREVATYLDAYEEQRARTAETFYKEARSLALRQELDAAANSLGTLASQMREQFFGDEPSPFVSEAERLARDIAGAKRRLESHFAPYDAELERARPAGIEAPFRALAVNLEQCRAKALEDEKLATLLGALPPSGSREDEQISRHDKEVARRYDPRAFVLGEYCSRAWSEVSREAHALCSRNLYGEALLRLEAFGQHALPTLEAQLQRLRTTFEDESESRKLNLGTFTARTQESFFEYVGDRHYALARGTLDEAEKEGRKWPDDDNAALELVRSGVLLLASIEQLAWEPFREHIRLGRPLDAGIQFGTIRENPDHIERLVLEQNEIAVYRRGAPKPLVFALSSVALRDLLRYSKIDGSRPQGALVIAALRLTEYPYLRYVEEDPWRVTEDLREVEALLITAERDEQLAPMAGRLSGVRSFYLREADRGALELEGSAQRKHEEAVASEKRGDYRNVIGKVDEMFRKPLVRTQYVQTQVEQLEILRSRAEQTLKTRGYADFFPGANILQLPRGHGALQIDFEDAQIGQWIEFKPAVVEPVTRGFVSADVAGLHAGDGAGAVHPGHVLAWSAWKGEPALHPKNFPVHFPNPFEYRRPIEVSFLYRSDAPYALIVSVAGATCGILSSADDREGGRGVRIWHADDLERPDLAFNERFRPGALKPGSSASRTKGETEYFSFRPGRVYRVRFVKEERRARLFVDERLLLTSDIKPSPTGGLSDRIVLLSYTSGEIDQLRVTGLLSPTWLKARKK